MKRVKTALVICAFAGILTFPTHAATTDPVGYQTTALSSGNNPFAPTFVHGASFSGAMNGIVEAVDQSTITVTAPGWSGSEFNEGTHFPLYYLEVTESGTDQGYIFDVISNDTSSVTVAGLLTTDFSFDGDEQFVIRKHMTLGDVFSASSEDLSAFVDTVKFFNSDGSSSTLLWTGAIWTPDGSTDHSSKPIYPGNGFLSTFTGSVSVTVNGAVKNTSTKVPIYSGVNNFISVFSPVDKTVGTMSLEDSLVAYVDTVKIIDQDGSLLNSETYISTGTFLTKDGSSDHGSDDIQGNNAFLINSTSNYYVTIPSPLETSAPPVD